MPLLEGFNGSNYVQNSVGNPTKQACICATTTSLSNLPGVINVFYNNGVAGTGATLTITFSTNYQLSIDNYVPMVRDRILIKNENDARGNGIYVLTTAVNANPVILKRADDYCSTGLISRQDIVDVIFGNTNANTRWNQSVFGNIGVITIGTHYLSFNRINPRNTLLNYNNLSDLSDIINARSNLNVHTSTASLGSNLLINYNNASMLATFSLTPNLENLGNATTLGFVTRIANETYAQRSFSGTNGVTITNPSGTNGDSIFGLASVPASVLANYPNSTNSFLRGDGTWTLPSINSLNIDGNVWLGIYNLYTSGNLGASGTMYANILQSYNTGNITLYSLLNANNNSITNVANGVSAGDAVNFGQALTNPIYSGTGAMTIVKGSTAQRPIGVSGMIRWNSTLSQYEGYTGSAWVNFVTGTPTVYVSSVAVTGSTGLTVSGSPITNSGTISFTLGAELQGLSSLSTNGFAVRTASGTYASRTLTTTTGSNSLSITNGNGVSGNPQISLSGTAGMTTTGNGSFGNVTATGNGSFGNVTATGEISAPNVNTNALAPSTNPTITTGALTITAGVSNTLSFGFLNSSGTTGTASGTNFYSVFATYRIKASEFNAVSSIKKKHVLAQGEELEKEVVEIIKKTEFFKYEYKDKLAEKGVRYGVIAEELGKTLPDYVDYNNMEYIPNIMQRGESKVFKRPRNEYTITVPNNIEIPTGSKKLKLINSKNKVIEVSKFDMLAKKTLKITSQEEITEEIFVYGTYEQCPSVASKVTELALIAVKNLITRIEKLEGNIV